MLTWDRVPKQSVADAVFAQLRRRILSGQIPAGATLPPERVLCAELGVSRTAVREAVARLEQVRLLAVRHGGETLVLDWRKSGGLDLLQELARSEEPPVLEVLRSGFEMRAVLAPEIARLAAERADESVHAELGATLGDMERAAGDLSALQRLSLRFWAALTEGSENLAYRLAFNSLRDAVLAHADPIAAAMADELRDTEGYEAIAAAVRKGDATAAAEAARAHIALGHVARRGARTRKEMRRR
jgi:DNA-binding FadR family transcriptional regulator